MYRVVNDFIKDVSTKRAPVLVATDLDGTIAPNFPTGKLPELDAEAVKVIQRLAKSKHTRVVVVSGRRLENLVKSCAPLQNVWLIAEHGGAIRSPSGEVRRPKAPVDLEGRDRLVDEIRPTVARVKGAKLDVKPAGVVLDLRGVDEARRAPLEALFGVAARCARGKVIEGRGRLEARFRATTKGSALADLLGEMPPSTAAIYAGDDPTDDSAFDVVRRRSPGLAFHVRSKERPVARAIVDAVLPDRKKWIAVLGAIGEGLVKPAG